MFNLHPTRIAELLQLVTAPAFLVAGIGTLLNVLTARLARVVDRARDEFDEDDDAAREESPERAAFDLSLAVGLLFIATVFTLVASLIVFLRAVFVATAMLRRSHFRPGRGALRRAA